jgi:multidrug efflux pump subunit AcrA (membrane-fusion protein)
MNNLSELIALTPQVRLDLGNHVAEWDAEFLRFSDSVDTETRTIGVVVAVDKPFDKIIPGYRPPLSKGMFVQVVLKGPPQSGRIVVPRSAIRGGTIYLADERNRLQSRPVEVLFNQGGFSVIKSGITAGEKVVLTDLIPAVPGMLLRPQVDEQVMLELSALAGDGS